MHHLDGLVVRPSGSQRHLENQSVRSRLLLVEHRRQAPIFDQLSFDVAAGVAEDPGEAATLTCGCDRLPPRRCLACRRAAASRFLSGSQDGSSRSEYECPGTTTVEPGPRVWRLHRRPLSRRHWRASPMPRRAGRRGGRPLHAYAFPERRGRLHDVLEPEQLVLAGVPQGEGDTQPLAVALERFGHGHQAIRADVDTGVARLD